MLLVPASSENAPMPSGSPHLTYSQYESPAVPILNLPWSSNMKRLSMSAMSAIPFGQRWSFIPWKNFSTLSRLYSDLLSGR